MKVKGLLRVLWKLLITLPLLLVTMYAGGYIAQFITNYQEWQNAGNFMGNGTHPAFPSYNFFVCIKSVFHFPNGLIGVGICIGAVIILIIFIRMGNEDAGDADSERNLTYSKQGTYGTSGFMTPKEMDKVLETVSSAKSTRGTILGKLNGKVVCVPEKSRMNRNIAVYGASGSMKSRAFARNMVFQCVKRGESLVLTDPKSELYEDMSEYLRQNAYTVKVFNLINPENSDSWNCLNEIEGQEIMAQLFADVIIKNTISGKFDHFWDNSELNLLKALVLFVEQVYPAEDKNIGEVYKLLTLSSEKELNSLFDGLPIEHPAKAPFSIFKQAAESVRGGIIIGLGSRLQVFQNSLIRTITSFNDIDLTLPGKEKSAYFCITSDQDSTFDFLSSLFLSFLFIKLVRYADKTGGLPVPVHILADELANIGVIPDLTKKISTIRSRNISMSVIFQNLAQMQNRYPLNQWQEIIGNCDVQLFLGCTDEITAKFISDRTGEVTIGVSSKAKQLNTWRMSNYTPEYRETNSIGKRKLLTPDEVLRLPIEKALVIVRGQKVLKVDKYDYSLHPESGKLTPKKASEHIPAWADKFPEIKRNEPAAAEQPIPEQNPVLTENKKKHKREKAKTKKFTADKFDKIGTKTDSGGVKLINEIFGGTDDIERGDAGEQMNHCEQAEKSTENLTAPEQAESTDKVEKTGELNKTKDVKAEENNIEEVQIKENNTENVQIKDDNAEDMKVKESEKKKEAEKDGLEVKKTDRDSIMRKKLKNTETENKEEGK